MIKSGESLRVPPGAARTRLDRYLAEIFPGQSRSQIQTFIRDGSILVNHERVKTGCLLHHGDVISFAPGTPEPVPSIRPEPIPLNVIYEDADLAVIEKPAGMVCHAGAGVHEGTLVNALLYHFGSLDAGDPLRPGIVHRLDKLTSGLLVVTKTQAAHRDLALQFRERKVEKEYLALVYGRPALRAGTIDLPLGRDVRDRKKISVHSRRRREAVTHYREEYAAGPFTLLRIRIETGRTHQIRVHLAQAGHPVVGDSLYGGNRLRNLTDVRIQSTVRNLQRHFLHAHRLAFRHPRTGESLAFHSPLPEELAEFLDGIAPSGRPAGLDGPRNRLNPRR